MRKRTLVGYILTEEHGNRDENERTVFVYDYSEQVEWVLTIYSPTGLRGYASGAESSSEPVLVERGLIAPDLTPESIRDVVAFAAQTQRSVNWLAGFGCSKFIDLPDDNELLEELFKVEVEAHWLPD